MTCLFTVIILFQLPADLTLKISERLAINNDWAHLGSKLKLLSTEEINRGYANHVANHGNYVLQKWTDSSRSFKDLIDGKLQAAIVI